MNEAIEDEGLRANSLSACHHRFLHFLQPYAADPGAASKLFEKPSTMLILGIKHQYLRLKFCEKGDKI